MITLENDLGDQNITDILKTTCFSCTYIKVHATCTTRTGQKVLEITAINGDKISISMGIDRGYILGSYNLCPLTWKPN